MILERFSDRARRVVGLAAQETVRVIHGAIGAKHVIPGMICGKHDTVTAGRFGLAFTRDGRQVIEAAFEQAHARPW